jgi:hypothetical protein
MNQRKGLPHRRQATNFKGKWNGMAIFISCGYYNDGTLGEVFLSAGKLQSGMDTAAKDAAIAISLALQFGCPVETLANAFLRLDDTTPEGLAGWAMRTILDEGLDKLPPFEPEPAGLNPPDPPLPPIMDAEMVIVEAPHPDAVANAEKIENLMSTAEMQDYLAEHESNSPEDVEYRSRKAAYEADNGVAP